MKRSGSLNELEEFFFCHDNDSKKAYAIILCDWLDVSGRNRVMEKTDKPVDRKTLFKKVKELEPGTRCAQALPF